MEPIVCYAADLVRTVRESKHLNLVAAATMTGYSTSAINRYELGQAPVPADYLARLFQCTGDGRLVQFVWPAVVFTRVAVQPARVPPPGDPGALMRRELGALEGLADAARDVYSILDDGAVDDRDDLRLIELQRKHGEIRELTAQVDHALAHWRHNGGRSPLRK